MSAWAFTVTEVDVVTGLSGAAVAVTVIDGGIGRPGDTGLSAYELAVMTGFDGSLEEWIASLQPTPDNLGLATVATSGAYNDLTGHPTIPSTPAAVGADPAGTAAAAVAAHAQALDPHGQYVSDDELAAALEALSKASVGLDQVDNVSAADLRARATHTGTQTSATIADFTEAVQDAVAQLLGAGSNVTLTYDDAADRLTIDAQGGTGGLDEEAVRDAIGLALVGVGLISVQANDDLDTITITTAATQNATDAALRDRGTHTGEQAIATITGLQTLLDALVPQTRAVNTGTGLTGGGPLTQDRTLAVQLGTSAGTVAAGDDARFTPPGGTTGQTLVKASNADHDTTWADLAAGGDGFAWNLLVSQDGSSTAGWGLDGATWSVNGGHLQVASTTNAWRTARYDAVPLPRKGYMAVEAEIELQATMSGTSDYVGVGLLKQGSVYGSSANIYSVAQLQGRDTVRTDQNASVAVVGTIPPLADGWHYLMIIYSPSLVEVYVDGALVAVSNPIITSNEYRLSVGVYGSLTARFRNMRAWVGPGTPVPADSSGA